MIMYPTNLEETQWQVIKKILNLQERRRKYDLREIWNVIFYLVKTGCQWRMLTFHFTPLGIGLLLLPQMVLLGRI